MKKLLPIFISFFLTISSSNAVEFSLGLSANGGILNANGTEDRIEQGINLSSKSRSEDLYVAYGSIFAEVHLLNDIARLGISHVPYALESETTESTQTSLNQAQGGTGEADRSQKVQVDLENLTTMYISLYHSTGFFVKAGAMQGDLITNESLDSGSSYGNATLEGITAGVGYERDLDNGLFIRAEVNYVDYDDIALSATTQSDDSHFNNIALKDLDGYTGALSVGKTF